MNERVKERREERRAIASKLVYPIYFHILFTFHILFQYHESK